MAKYFVISKHWVCRVADYNELPSGKVYYTVAGKKYRPANKDDFIECSPEDFDYCSGTLCHLKN